mmetsp:Transcript_58307/g.132070  ORF Transcript_58307/g.132070 Transcript_58307/m.132070 type:complete len:209 (-) Transcript_58307:118-744(-)
MAFIATSPIEQFCALRRCKLSGSSCRTSHLRAHSLADPDLAASTTIALAGIQEIRELTQASAQSLVSSLLFRLALGVIGSIVTGTFFKIFEDAILAGKKTALSGQRIDWPLLYACLFVDLVGDTSFLIPGAGETEDILWAPISAWALTTLFNSPALGVIDFVKEILPFSDIIPVATIAWVLRYLYPESGPSKFLGLDPKDSDTNGGNN